MMLSPNFSLQEFIASDFAARNGLSNSPDELTLERLKLTAHYLEGVRAILGKPISITSGYRSALVNKAIGGVATSAHQFGYAVDFRSPFGDPLAVCEKLRGTLGDFDQLIYEYEAWTHLSFDPRMRREVLTIKKDGKGYQPGLVP